MNNVIIGIILILIFIIATWLLLLSKDVASSIKSLETRYVDLQSKVNTLVEQHGILLTANDIIEGYKKAYNTGLISKEIYEDIIKGDIN